VEERFADGAGDGEQGGEDPGVTGRMGVAAHIDEIAEEDIAGVVGMEGIDLGVLGGGEVIVVVALDGLVQERQAQEEYEGEDDEDLFTRQIPV
jgi:hypothetical protein